MIRRIQQGEIFVALGEAFEITRSRAYGHVQAVAAAAPLHLRALALIRPQHVV